METQQQKRKLQDSSEEQSENKKKHKESDITFENVAADSTHIESQSVIENLVKETTDNSRYGEEETFDESLLRTIVDACSPSSEENASLQVMIKSLQEILKRKDEEIEELKTNNLMLNKKVTDLEKKIDDFKLSSVTNKINVNKYKSRRVI